MKDKETLLKDKLIELDTEYECSISAGTHREPDEISDDAYTQDEAEDIARNKSESYSKPDGSEVEDVSIRDSELDRCTYVEEEIEYLEEEVLDE